MRYYLSVLTTIILFSTIEVFSKVLHGKVDTMLLAFCRFFFSGLILILIDVKRIKLYKFKDIKELLILSLLGVTATFTFFHTSIGLINASIAAVIFSINPIFCSIMAIFFHNEKLKGITFIGLIGGLLGVYMVSFGFTLPVISGIFGPILMLLASIFFSLYIVWAKKFVKKYGAFSVTGIAFLMGSLFMIPMIKSWYIPINFTSISALAYLTLFTTALAYILYFYGLKHLSVAAGTSFFYLKPVFAPILAVIILKEELNFTFYIGVFLILSSMAITLISEKKS